MHRQQQVQNGRSYHTQHGCCTLHSQLAVRQQPIRVVAHTQHTIRFQFACHLHSSSSSSSGGGGGSGSSMAQVAVSRVARRVLQQCMFTSVASTLSSSSSAATSLGCGLNSRISSSAATSLGCGLNSRISSSAATSLGCGLNSRISSNICASAAAMPRCCVRSSAAAANAAESSSSSSKRPSSSAAGDGWVVNKEPISTAMSPQLYSYLLAHTREPPVLAELRLETAGMHGGHMQIAPEQGQLLSLLVELLGVKSAIEVGVFTGYSALAVAVALPEDGRLVALDRDPVSMEVARRYWKAAGVAAKIDSRLGPALDGLQQLLQENGESSFDFAFIDADKRGYQAYFEYCLKLVRPGGLVAVDNVLFYGKVADVAAADKATMALKQFNDDLLADDRVTFSIVPVGDGMALCRKR